MRPLMLGRLLSEVSIFHVANAAGAASDAVDKHKAQGGKMSDRLQGNRRGKTAQQVSNQQNRIIRKVNNQDRQSILDKPSRGIDNHGKMPKGWTGKPQLKHYDTKFEDRPGFLARRGPRRLG